METRVAAVLVLVSLAACGGSSAPAPRQALRDAVTMQPSEQDTSLGALLGAYADQKISADSAARLFLDYVQAHKPRSLNVQMDAPLREAILREQQRRAKR